MSTVQERLEEVIRLIVDEPDEVELSEEVEGRDTYFELRVAEPDLGKVIGRQGRTARALRALLAARGGRERQRYDLQILDD